mmetsp:Transcript_15175/g.34590  ORF Transcript_15175/g.34590 Transcript_15175/m.34590 type:complete len:215 (+) Transcript_15175:84-728(+)
MAAMDAVVSPDEIDLLAQLFRECNLTDKGHDMASSQVALMLGADTLAPSMSSVAPVPGTEQQASFGFGDAATPATMMPWAQELVQRLQECPSSQAAESVCAHMLSAFHGQVKQEVLRQHQAQQQERERMKSVQAANKVLLRALHALSRRHKELALQSQEIEKAAQWSARELARSQEALQASERTRESLQMHLRLMGNHLQPATGGSQDRGPPVA